ncbi:hypothetical protein B9G55_22785 [Saccharibacillus sp. O16]|nr:hypothetical protein B9G55_22785 [Saccharibacillus sp. O16]
MKKFHLERVGAEDSLEPCNLSGFGQLALFQCEVEYHFNAEEISLEEAESYIQDVLNQLPDASIDELCKQAYEWKEDQMSSNNADYPDGLAACSGRSILNFMSVGEVHLYRNPNDRQDRMLGAVLSGGTDWDAENGMEIVVRGSDVLEVREYLGYGGFAIWEEEVHSE